ncbi:ABC-type Fe3+ transport system, substrate-binding protein [Trichlorobacter thiogenes]|uniref:ABC-type Fe3+ transport system, substrate-binding protein n=1 Tax=Trichlorobacter thiogenes TaxID=115783 RepID=A0A1T4LJC2_9BACT|nr:ABC transporter substrate-binding protein [Trichlorobacter thiogenes]SJZ54829.1 ABC-type Fe3+ transport system, substrate-binding protein [Trichlorobacter thiogenes]
MSAHRIQKDMTIKELLEQHPETLEVLVANGFENLKDPKVLAGVGGFLKLERAALTKNYDLDNFLGLLQQKVDEKHNQVDVTMKQTQQEQSEISISGLLPCPVRLPLLEGFDRFIEQYTRESGVTVSYKFEAASLGSAWMDEHIQTVTAADQLPDIFVSAGFETFFDPATIGKFKEQGVFADLTGDAINRSFDGLELKDPKGHYGLISVVPSAFMVNHDELGDLPVPRTWADILKPEFEQKVALPVGDFDLFNAILLTIHKMYGDEGVRKLGRCMLKSMHPAQMIKNAQRVAEEKPPVTIIPYFFSRMAGMVKSLEIVWPEDGAIISPIFMLAKADKQAKLQPIADFLCSKEVGDTLTNRGLFPALNPEVENQLPEQHPWQWVGWDYLYSHDIAAQIRYTVGLFEEAMNAD